MKLFVFAALPSLFSIEMCLGATSSNRNVRNLKKKSGKHDDHCKEATVYAEGGPIGDDIEKLRFVLYKEKDKTTMIGQAKGLCFNLGTDVDPEGGEICNILFIIHNNGGLFGDVGEAGTIVTFGTHTNKYEEWPQVVTGAIGSYAGSTGKVLVKIQDGIITYTFSLCT